MTLNESMTLNEPMTLNECEPGISVFIIDGECDEVIRVKPSPAAPANRVPYTLFLLVCDARVKDGYVAQCVTEVIGVVI